jgi:hypothetical protein
MTRRIRIIARAGGLMAATAALLAASGAGAWNGKGHMTVAAAAWKQMTPDARAKASALLRLNPDYPNWVRGVHGQDVDAVAFVKAATWPDQIRSTYQEDGSSPPGAATDAQNIGFSDCLKHRYWHFKDIPFSTDGTALEDAQEPNALTQIRAFSAALASSGTSDEIKSYDLAWLLHLVGDVHQPLHATSRFSASSRHGDHGGNSVTLCVRGHSCSSRFNSLHAYWDDALGTGDSAGSALRLACVQNVQPGGHCLPTPDPDAVAIGEPGTWVQESFELARTVAYKRPIGPGRGPFYVTARYQAAVASTAENQVALAGARLAKLLNSALGSGGQVATSAPLPDAGLCPRLQ